MTGTKPGHDESADHFALVGAFSISAAANI
jgi:hypothetical protein